MFEDVYLDNISHRAYMDYLGILCLNTCITNTFDMIVKDMCIIYYFAAYDEECDSRGGHCGVRCAKYVYDPLDSLCDLNQVCCIGMFAFHLTDAPRVQVAFYTNPNMFGLHTSD